MFKVSNNGNIIMNRGESASLPLFINASHRMTPIRYKLNTNDVVCFYITEPNQLFEDAIIKKNYTRTDLNPYGDVVIRLESKDTFYLNPGNYYYEVKLIMNGLIKTIVPRTKFVILE